MKEVTIVGPRGVQKNLGEQGTGQMGSYTQLAMKARLQFSTLSWGRLVPPGSLAHGSDKLLSSMGVPSVLGTLVLVTGPLSHSAPPSGCMSTLTFVFSPYPAEVFSQRAAHAAGAEGGAGLQVPECK